MFIIISIILLSVLTHLFLSTLWFLLHAFLHFWSNLSFLFNLYWLLQDYENTSYIVSSETDFLYSENKFHIFYVNNDKLLVIFHLRNEKYFLLIRMPLTTVFRLNYLVWFLVKILRVIVGKLILVMIIREIL